MRYCLDIDIKLASRQLASVSAEIEGHHNLSAKEQILGIFKIKRLWEPGFVPHFVQNESAKRRSLEHA